MSSQQVRSNDATASASVASVDMKLEVVVIPVSDVDRAKEFYSRLGWRLDADRAAGNNFRLFQFTPPGSGSSVQFGVNLTQEVAHPAPPFGVRSGPNAAAMRLDDGTGKPRLRISCVTSFRMTPDQNLSFRWSRGR